MRTIRRATDGDIQAICELYAAARAFMRESGNRSQWVGGYPDRSDVERDLAAEALFVCVDENDVPQAAFFFTQGPDPTYATIAGEWADEGPYHVVHRIAARRGSGAGRECLAWACGQARSVRIDTHEDNRPMRHVLGLLGFVECGTIWLEDGSPRVAYQHVGVTASD